MSILEDTFSDLILGNGSHYIKGTISKGIQKVDEGHYPELDKIYSELGEKDQQDFLYRYEGEYFRAARMETVSGVWFTLRRSNKQILSMSDLGFPDVIRKYLLNTDLLPSGLLLFAGRTGAGKTTSVSGFLKDRLDSVGGHAVTIEDPPEMPLHGEYEKGVCFQREMHHTRFAQGIVDAMRYASPDVIMLGELRESQAVSEALKAAINGHLIVATIHTPNVQGTLQRVYSLAHSIEGDGAAALLAEGYSGVIHQRLENGRLKLELLFAPEKDVAIRGKIRECKFHQLSTNIQEQMNKFFLGG